MKLLLTFITTLLLLLSTGCGNADDSAKESSKMTANMKCGAGKCGANMFDGSASLVKKKVNITKQMREDDPRQECVSKAATTKALYDCLRDPKSGKLTKKCGAMQKEETMKCGAGKCGSI